MAPIFIILAGILGVVLASLTSLQGERVPLKGWVALRRGFCSHCELGWSRWRRLPLVWYLATLGRCPHCGRALSGSRLVWELCGGIFAIALILWFGPGVEFYRHLALSALLAWELSLVLARIPPSWALIGWSLGLGAILVYLGAIGLLQALLGGVALLAGRGFYRRLGVAHVLAISGLLGGFLGHYQLFFALFVALLVDLILRIRRRRLLYQIYAGVALGAVLFSGPLQEIIGRL